MLGRDLLCVSVIAVEWRKERVRPDEEFDANFFRGIDYICSLHLLVLVLHVWVEEDRNSDLSIKSQSSRHDNVHGHALQRPPHYHGGH